VIIDHIIRIFEACPGIPLLEEGYYTHIQLVADEFGKLFIIAIAAMKVAPRELYCSNSRFLDTSCYLQ